MTNLLENAGKLGSTASWSAIRSGARDSSQRPGPGIPAVTLEQVFEPFSG
jgi:signal transduction histidine kinase